MRALPVLLAVAVGLSVPSAGLAQEDQVYRPGDGVTVPKPLKQVKPEYTDAARVAQVEGVVTLECVVRSDGTPTEIRVVAPLHPQLDEASTRALGQWLFVPGTKDGKPVAVRIQVEMSFALRDAEPPRRGPALGSPEVYKPGKDVTTPVLIRDEKPRYTADALRDGAQGRVHLECVVLPDGTVGDIRVNERLHPQLDEEAVRTLRRWTFKPGMKEGVAVPVQVEVEMHFTLRKGPRKSGDER